MTARAADQAVEEPAAIGYFDPSFSLIQPSSTPEQADEQLKRLAEIITLFYIASKKKEG